MGQQRKIVSILGPENCVFQFLDLDDLSIRSQIIDEKKYTLFIVFKFDKHGKVSTNEIVYHIDEHLKLNNIVELRNFNYINCFHGRYYTNFYSLFGSMIPIGYIDPLNKTVGYYNDTSILYWSWDRHFPDNIYFPIFQYQLPGSEINDIMTWRNQGIFGVGKTETKIIVTKSKPFESDCDFIFVLDAIKNELWKIPSKSFVIIYELLDVLRKVKADDKNICSIDKYVVYTFYPRSKSGHSIIRFAEVCDYDIEKNTLMKEIIDCIRYKLNEKGERCEWMYLDYDNIMSYLSAK